MAPGVSFLCGCAAPRDSAHILLVVLRAAVDISV
eukprot:SAG22_NODE_869_length_6749_cov_3.048120_4_plen_34_part_00